MKKILKIMLIALAVLVALLLLAAVGGSIFGGSFAKKYVNNHSEELIGRQAHVNHVGLNLLTGHAAIHGLEVMEEDGSTRFAKFDTLDVSVSLLRLLGKRVQIRHVTLAGFDAHIVQDSTRFNFSSIIDHFQRDSAEVEEVEDTTPSGWVVSLHKIRLAENSMLYEDRPRGSHLGFHHLNLLVPDFIIGGSESTDAALTLTLAEGGELSAYPNYDASTGNFAVGLSLKGFTLDQLKPYLMDRTYIEAIKGSLALDATAEGNIAHFIETAIAAKLSLADVAVVDSSKAEVVSLDGLKVDMRKMVLSQRLFDIGSVVLNGLTAKYELFADSSNTISRLLVRNSKSGTEAAPSDEQEETETADTLPTPPLQLHVGHLDIHNVNFTYADHTMPTDFVFPVTDLSVESVGVTASGSNNARLRANLPNGATLSADWKGDIGQWKRNLVLELSLKGLHLTDLSPYMVAYFGMPFSDGIFGFTSLNSIVNSRLEGNNHIDIFKPTLGEKLPEVTPRLRLPVKAALYVMKDKDGKVLLDIPVKGNVDNPEFNYMKLVWKALGNLIVKVATSPARLLKGMKDEGEELFVPIDWDEEGFTSEQIYLIDQVADLAKKDEKVVLVFELQTRPNSKGKDKHTANQHNRALASHLGKLGLGKSQYDIHTADPDKNVAVEGYAVKLRVKE